MSKYIEENKADSKKRLMDTAKECLEKNCGERPELKRLKELYEKRRAACGLNRADMDAFLYERIHGEAPSNSTEPLKLRYWRTGHHYPANRQICLDFARALELNERDTRWLMTAWMDKSVYFHEKTPPKEEVGYWSRRKKIQTMIQTYFDRRFPATKKFSQNAFRHRYYLDALNCIDAESSSAFWKGSLDSINYDSELKRTSMLLGEIPRRTMLRHLILLSLPRLTLKKLQAHLSFFGYLPLMPEHTTINGDYLDCLVMESVELYEHIAGDAGPQEAMDWFMECWQELDHYFVSEGKPGFRLFYFKALG